MYNNTIIRFSFCDIWNNQGFGKAYQPQPSASADNPCPDLDYSGYHKNFIQLFFYYLNMVHLQIIPLLKLIIKRDRGSRYGPPKVVPCRGSRGTPFSK